MVRHASLKLRVLLLCSTWPTLCLGALPAGATVVFEGTGADFLDDPDTVFPTVTPTLSGTSLDFVLGPANEDRILAIHPLAPAGSFADAGGAVTVTIDVGLTRGSEDFDPVFLASDGVTAVGGQVGDNPNGSARLIEATRSGDAVVPFGDAFLFDDAGFVPIGASLGAAVEIALGAASSEVGVAFLGGSASAIVTTTVDVASALDFLLVANTAIATEEVYRIDTLRIEIVPEPGPAAQGAALLGLALAASMGRRGAATSRS